MRTTFCAYFWFVDWKCISLGVSLNLSPMHAEIHLPFGFIRVGWERTALQKPLNWDAIKWRCWGWHRKYA